ncbi:hypothetical protein IMG5_001670 [Ichthyophthirius multifiliis]|uniref:Transmembrane protein n=1 Tax=Ichthyophthirius multifiliis TaxID=5932 RepID=G0QIZ7_ICHMU|nr:hypothetical protein IMG5_001670 [Ichthyophthirius multifiliis]EGR34790.1 hypothetical protein IMG5_001670 [Ichthyophthirius multifiliis]|eukprot:XP_004040094.1 hypothetical protein IMG5_001670 [Ichthyophthirius multifiliis]
MQNIMLINHIYIYAYMITYPENHVGKVILYKAIQYQDKLQSFIINNTQIGILKIYLRNKNLIYICQCLQKEDNVFFLLINQIYIYIYIYIYILCFIYLQIIFFKNLIYKINFYQYTFLFYLNKIKEKNIIYIYLYIYIFEI